MKQKFIFNVLFVSIVMLCAHCGHAQPLGVQWQKLYGSQSIENGRAVVQTSDGGYLIASTVIGSKRSDAHGQSDIWLLKTDASGSVQWDKLYGGSWDEYVNSVVESQDGGIVVLGSTASRDGDVTGLHDTSAGSKDIWVFKINGAGNIVWQKTIGGNGSETGSSMLTIADNKLLVLGTTNSTDGDVRDLHYDLSSGPIRADILLLSLDANGGLLWQKCYGGLYNETGFEIHQMNDGSYFLSGMASSDNGDVQGGHGEEDVFVLKIDGSGNILKSRCIGGSQYESGGSFAQRPGDSGFMMLMYTESQDGDFAGTTSYMDYVLLRMDSAFNIQWIKNYGGSSFETPGQIISLPHGGYVLGGKTASVNGDLDSSLITTDQNRRIWLLQVDESGRKLRSTVMGGSAPDNFGMMASTKDGGYIFVGNTESPDGTLSNETLFGKGDVWVVKMMDATLGISNPNPAFAEPLVFPTKTNGPVNVRFEQSVIAHISVQNAYGALVAQSKFFGSNAAIDLSSEPAGIYFLTISMDASKKSVKVLKY